MAFLKMTNVHKLTSIQLQEWWEEAACCVCPLCKNIESKHKRLLKKPEHNQNKTTMASTFLAAYHNLG